MILKLITFVLFFAVEPISAKSIARRVRRLQPTLAQGAITSALGEMTSAKVISKISRPHLPTLFYLNNKAREQVAGAAWPNSKAWQARRKKML